MDEFVDKLKSGRGKQLLSLLTNNTKIPTGSDHENILEPVDLEPVILNHDVSIINNNELNYSNLNDVGMFNLDSRPDYIFSEKDIIEADFVFEEDNNDVPMHIRSESEKIQTSDDDPNIDLIINTEVQISLDHNGEDLHDKDYVPNFTLLDSSSESRFLHDEPSTAGNEANVGVLNGSNEEALLVSEHVEESTTTNSRKRIRNEKLWAKNVKKQKINKGESYTTKSGNLVNKKTLKPGCSDTKCRLKCPSNINSDNRQKLLDDMLSLQDANQKRNFISKLIEEVHPKYTYKKDNSQRSTNYSYHFIIDGRKFKVCKKMFTDTFCISATYLTTVKNKTTSSGIIIKDLRGKHQNQPKTDPLKLKGIYDHINSFARIESHYCRADTKREFIDGELNVSEMYRLYKASCIEKGVVYVKKHKYEEIFNTKFNIGFFIPKKDQCSLCASYQNSSEEEKQKMEEEVSIHKREKELSREEKKQDINNSRDTNNSKTVVACFDLEAVIPLPKGKISTFYYKRKLNTFNFTVYDATTKQGHCYIWHEGCAKRGALEIASFLFDYLKENISGTGKEIIFYSDNCSGQNKNHVLLSMYLHAVKTLDIPSITHKYLIVGHTQNEGDTMHSSIERQLKKATNKNPIYVPNQLVVVVQTANKEKKQFHVKEMDTSDVYDWAAVENSFPGKNFQYSTSGNKVVWANVKVFEVRKSNPLTVFYKYSYGQNEMSSFNLDDKITKKKDGSVVVISRGHSCSPSTRDTARKSRKTNKQQPMAPSSVGKEVSNLLKPAYRTPPGIPSQKKADLINLCDSRLIPMPYHQFFQGLKCKDNDEN